MKIVGAALIILLFGLVLWWSGWLKNIPPADNSQSQAALAIAANLSSSNSFAVLAGSTITNTGSTVINGDLGLSPGTSVTGFPPGTLNGNEHTNDTAAAQAQTDLTLAYNNVAGQLPVSTIPAELGGTTKLSGIYDSVDTTFGITGILTLDAEGDPNAVFIFKTGSTLTAENSSNVVLTNGAQACNVFWQVGSSATLGTDSNFKGNILAFSSITLNTDAEVEGRVLARNGAVTLDTNLITVPPCTIIPAPPAPVVQSTSSGGGGASTWSPLINVVKVPNPLVLPAGPGPVTYTYTLTNTGPIPVTSITMVDDTCSPAIFISGDTNNDAILDLSETWIYRCNATLTATHTNIVTATGWANGISAIDTANATVIVGAPTVPPLIQVTKIPSPLALLVGGGTVTYTNRVTNPGIIALENVRLTDDKCSPVRYISGDTNGNLRLDINEAWIYTCQSNLSMSTTNTVTAEGWANGLVARDFAIATVMVGIPRLPNTGISQ